MSLKGGVNTGIGYSIYYEQWDAFINAGASMDELMKLEEGEYPNWFVARVMAWNRSHKYIENHVEDAVASKSNKKR